MACFPTMNDFAKAANGNRGLVRPRLRRWWLLVAFLVLGAGCRTVQPAVGLPTRHSLTGEQLLVRSDLRLPKDHALIADLAELRQEIAQTLQLPVQEQPVTVYLFADELRYAQYMKSAYPT